jgi:enolase-phosphatase E1
MSLFTAGIDARAALVSIEGAISSRSYLLSTVTWYARQRLPAFLAQHAGDPALEYVLARVRELAGPAEPPPAALLRWLDEGREVAPLQDIQGFIWDEACGDGALQGHIFPDALGALRRWRAAGVHRHAFASGSAHWQAQFFRHCPEGDLSGLFGRHFDLAVGSKSAATSYRAIAAALHLPPREICFFSDTPRELLAARSAGLSAVQVIRDAIAADERFPQIHSFDEVASLPIRYAAE